MNFRSLLLGGVMALGSFGAVADEDKGAKNDWRKSGSDKKKLEQLVKTVPSTSRIMLQMGERYKNLYWAAKLGKWEFAEYQLEEMEDLIELLQITRPERAATAEVFLEQGLEPLEKALSQRRWESFYKGFSHMGEQCMKCHADNDHAFITLPTDPKTAASPVLNLGP